MTRSQIPDSVQLDQMLSRWAAIREQWFRIALKVLENYGELETELAGRAEFAMCAAQILDAMRFSAEMEYLDVDVMPEFLERLCFLSAKDEKSIKYLQGFIRRYREASGEYAETLRVTSDVAAFCTREEFTGGALNLHAIYPLFIAHSRLAIAKLFGDASQEGKIHDWLRQK